MDNKAKHTKFLGPKEFDKPKMKPRLTGALDIITPWVIEFRVVGTPNIIKVRVTEEMLVGRPDPNNDVEPAIDVTPHGGHTMGVSRRHAIIRTGNNRITIEDLDSANNTYINEHVLESGKEYRIRDRDIIRLGHMRLQVHFVVKPSTTDETNHNIHQQMEIPKIGNGERILVVDDDRNMTDVISVILRHAGFTAVVKHSATDAMTEIDNNPPSGIITELVLPDMSGIDIIRYSQLKNDKTPILVVSTATGGFQMGQAIEHGIQLFMAKPIAIDELIRAVEKMKMEIRPI